MAVSTLEMLLAALNQGAPQLPNPAPSAQIPLNVPQPPLAGPPREINEPPVAPLDTRIVNQYTALGGERPTPPAPPTRLQRIANALMGFGAGFEGRGAEFLNYLNEPRRRYENRLDDYNARRDALRLRGEERALDDQERRTRRAQQLADREFEAEYQRESRRLNLQDDESKMRLQQSLEIEREARRQRLETARELERERREQEREARHISDQYWNVTRNKTLSDEIGKYRAGLKPSLSPAAAALERRVMQIGDIQMGRAATGGGGGKAGRVNNEAQAALERFNQARQALITALQQGNGKAADAYREAMNRAFKSLARYPREVEMFSQDPNWPFAQMRNSPAPQQQQQQQADPLGVLR